MGWTRTVGQPVTKGAGYRRLSPLVQRVSTLLSESFSQLTPTRAGMKTVNFLSHGLLVSYPFQLAELVQRTGKEVHDGKTMEPKGSGFRPSGSSWELGQRWELFC